MIDFTEIPSEGGLTFERFVEDFLRALGWTIIVGAGKGPDGGRDIVASHSEITATGREWHRRFVVQCKHYAGSGRSVTGKEISDCPLMPAKHDCQGWLLVTSTQLSSDATLNVEAARKAIPGVEFDYWDADSIRKHLLRNESRKVLAQYLPCSYGRCANILIPQPAEIRELIHSWVSAAADRTQRFSSDLDSDELLLSWVASKARPTRQTPRELLARVLI